MQSRALQEAGVNVGCYLFVTFNFKKVDTYAKLGNKLLECNANEV